MVELSQVETFNVRYFLFFFVFESLIVTLSKNQLLQIVPI